MAADTRLPGARADSKSVQIVIDSTVNPPTTVDATHGLPVTLIAGAAAIGTVAISQTGTENNVKLVAGTAIAGKFGIDQTTPGTTNAVAVAQLPASLGAKAASASTSVVQAGLEYETVAAGQTAQVLGATGATGDYLSHVILQPAAAAAGTTTILDNATVIFTYTAGTLSDLRPIIVPLNLFSVSGAWKITTGANMAAIGIGDFT